MRTEPPWTAAIKLEISRFLVSLFPAGSTLPGYASLKLFTLKIRGKFAELPVGCT